MSLYLKYRPKDFEALQGNAALIDSLRELLNREDLPHAFLFHGPTGCGKTTIARIIAETLGCVGNDYREVDSADFRGIDTVREIRKQSQFKPLEGPCRVWVIDEVHKMTNDAQNAMLKILEDTPSHIYFILCTTDPQKLLPTVRGRCSQYQVATLTDREMMNLLRNVVKQEGETLTRQIYEQIITDSLGHPRNALQILEQVLATSADKRLEVSQRVAEEQSQVIELCRALIKKAGWKEVAGILNKLDQDPESVRRAVMGYAQAVLFKGSNIQAGRVLESFVENFFNSGKPGLTLACYRAIEGD
jgi:DNA polymerase-3 subunit gamma/tau